MKSLVKSYERDTHNGHSMIRVDHGYTKAFMVEIYLRKMDHVIISVLFRPRFGSIPSIMFRLNRFQ